MSRPPDLLQGTLDLLILKILALEPQHGWAIGQRLRQLSSETLQVITDVIDAERQCCRWLRFHLAVEPNGGPMVLTLSGPEGARDFLSALFDL